MLPALCHLCCLSGGAACQLSASLSCAGFELPALGGAVASIAAGRVGVLTFSYGGHQEWQNGKLLDAVARLDELGYSCYLAGGCHASCQACGLP